MSEETEELHILGKITGYYGVKGWLKIYSYTQPRENIVRYKSLQIRLGNSRGASNAWQAIALDSGKAHGKGVVAHFTGYDTRELSAALIGAELAVPRSEFKPAAENEYYWTDLIGLKAVNLEGVELGQISSLMETAANDVLLIKPLQSNEAEILVPFVMPHFVKKVDLEQGVIELDWPVSWNDNSDSK